MDIRFSLHADQQMTDRKIERVWVEETINSPDETRCVKRKFYVTKRLNGKTLKVV